MTDALALHKKDGQCNYKHTQKPRQINDNAFLYMFTDFSIYAYSLFRNVCLLLMLLLLFSRYCLGQTDGRTDGV